jgi:hypothetical protein
LIGVSDDTVSEINFHFGACLTWYDTFERDGENIGFVFTHVKTSSFLGPELPSKKRLLNFNKYILNDYISLKPDLQIIVKPATTIELSDALVLTLRSEFRFKVTDCAERQKNI